MTMDEFGTTSYLVLAVLTLALVWYLSNRPWRNLPPGPPYLPVIGSLPFLGDMDFRKAFNKLILKHGDIFTVHLGPHRTVVLNGYKLIREALVKQGSVFAARPKMFAFDEFPKRKGILHASGHLWHDQRRFVLQVLRNFGLGRSTMEDIVSGESRRLVNDLKTKANKPCEPQILFQMAAANIISTIAFGKSWDYDDATINEFIRTARRLSEVLGVNNPLVLFPQLKYIPGDMFMYKRMAAAVDKFDATFQSWIDDHKQKIRDGETPTDLIGVYLMEMKKQELIPDTTFYEFQLLRVIADLFVAGTDTTSNTFSWLLYHLVKKREIQEKIVSEIEDVIGFNREPQLRDKNGMPYTEAVLSEAQRVADIAPIVPHATTEDTNLAGYFIPKDTMVIVNLHSVTMDPKIWPAPEEFDPGRFLNDDGSYRKREEFIPFSMGKRVCLGESLARSELFLFLTTILQSFELHSPEGLDRFHTEGVLGVVHHPKPYHLIFKTRE